MAFQRKPFLMLVEAILINLYVELEADSSNSEHLMVNV